MKIAIASDIHGDSLKPLKRELKQLDIDRVIILGDFDRVHTIREVMELANEWPTYVVPGNHDEAIVSGRVIRSPTLYYQHVSFRQIYNELQADDVAKSYLEELLKSHKKEIEIPTKNRLLKTLLLHGALDNTEDMGNKSTEVSELWRRLLKPEDHEMNFEAMVEKDYDLLLRGHDDEPQVACIDRNHIKRNKSFITLNQAPIIKKPSYDSKFILSPDRIYTITSGSYFDGHFTIIDTNVLTDEYPVVQFKQLYHF